MRSTIMWLTILCFIFTGRSTESTGMNTFSGKRPREQDMAYLSTPSYLRQMAGTEKPHRYGDPTCKCTVLDKDFIFSWCPGACFLTQVYIYCTFSVIV